jgi:NADH:ubiquinone oxidoreductase subunit 3 (subunit A)
MENVLRNFGKLLICGVIVISVLFFLFSLNTIFMYSFVATSVKIIFFAFMVACIYMGAYLFNVEYRETETEL